MTLQLGKIVANEEYSKVSYEIKMNENFKYCWLVKCFVFSITHFYLTQCIWWCNFQWYYQVWVSSYEIQTKVILKTTLKISNLSMHIQLYFQYTTKALKLFLFSSFYISNYLKTFYVFFILLLVTTKLVDQTYIIILNSKDMNHLR